MLESIRIARLRATFEAPYLSTALLSLIPKEVPDLRTMGVNEQWVLGYNREWVEAQPPEDLSVVLIHEVWHLLRQHGPRARNIPVKPDELEKSNWASDLEINDSLPRLPKGGLLPKDFRFPDNLLYEEYFKLLKDPPPSNGVGAGDCGSAARGNEPPDPAAPGLSQVREELIRQEVAQKISVSPGRVPKGAQVWAKVILTPQVDWRKELVATIRNFAQQAAGKLDFTYRRRSRRAASTRAILPGLVGYKPKISVIIDTSGSMDTKLLESAVTELVGILRLAERVQFYAGDTEAHIRKVIHSIHNASLEGGGGTDMGAIIKEADTLHPDIIVVLTDGYTPWGSPPRAKLVAGVFTTEEGPAWAKTIHIS